MRLHQECWIWFWSTQEMIDMDVLERDQGRATKMVTGLEHLFCEERL